MPRFLRDSTYRARALRRASTPAEDALWELLRGRRRKGAKFRRQAPLGPDIVDFFCEQARLVVEADGAYHFPRPTRDVVRDRLLRDAGITVLRIPNQEILLHPNRALSRIRALLPPLLPPGEGVGG